MFWKHTHRYRERHTCIHKHTEYLKSAVKSQASKRRIVNIRFSNELHTRGPVQHTLTLHLFMFTSELLLVKRGIPFFNHFWDIFCLTRRVMYAFTTWQHNYPLDQAKTNHKPKHVHAHGAILWLYVDFVFFYGSWSINLATDVADFSLQCCSFFSIRFVDECGELHGRVLRAGMRMHIMNYYFTAYQVSSQWPAKHKELTAKGRIYINRKPTQ